MRKRRVGEGGWGGRQEGHDAEKDGADAAIGKAVVDEGGEEVGEGNGRRGEGGQRREGQRRTRWEIIYLTLSRQILLPA